MDDDSTSNVGEIFEYGSEVPGGGDDCSGLNSDHHHTEERTDDRDGHRLGSSRDKGG